jgi:hypothetical protein
MHRIPRDEHQVTRLNSPRLVTHPKPALSFQHQDKFVMVWLDVDYVRIALEDVDVARDVLAITQERTLDRVRSGCRVGCETAECVGESKEVLWLHGVLLSADGATECLP